MHQAIQERGRLTLRVRREIDRLRVGCYAVGVAAASRRNVSTCRLSYPISCHKETIEYAYPPCRQRDAVPPGVHELSAVMSIHKRYLEWTDIEALVGRLIAELPTDYDVLLTIARGGLVPCCLISEQLDMRNILVAAVMYYTDVGKTMDRPLFLQFPDDIL